MGIKALIAVAAGAAALTGTAASAADFIVDSTTNMAQAGRFYTNFNARTLGNTTQTTDTGITVSFAGSGGFLQGSNGQVYQAPIVANGNGAFFGQADGVDTTTYVSSGIGSATLTLALPTTYFGLLWGSIDGYNSLTFNTADGLSRTFVAGDFGISGVSRYINFTSSSAITSVVARSSQNAFEFDNVATGAALPEPATWAMMLAGFGMVGFAMRRRQKVAARVTYAA